MQYFFDSFVLDTALRELSAGDETVRIEPKVFELLLHLLENRHRAISKDELVAAVWDGRFVTLDSANHILPVTDPAWPRCIRLMHDFLKD